MHNLINMPYCLSSVGRFLSLVCFLFLTVFVWRYLYTSRMEFATARSIFLFFPSLLGSISHMFEALNTLDSQFALGSWLMVTSSTFEFLHLLIFRNIPSLLPSDLKHY